MTKNVLIGIFSLIGMISCNNDDESVSKNLSGVYTETLPINGRLQLNFIDGNTVIKTETGSTFEDEFTYEIISNVIKLTPNWDNSTVTEFEIQIINSSKFEIENLYPSIPENPTTYMTFEK
jgi:hypothetical protein